jgi:hypothetical protein
MDEVGFELMIPVFHLAKTFLALESAATVIGQQGSKPVVLNHCQTAAR